MFPVAATPFVKKAIYPFSTELCLHLYLNCQYMSGSTSLFFSIDLYIYLYAIPIKILLELHKSYNFLKSGSTICQTILFQGVAGYSRSFIFSYDF